VRTKEEREIVRHAKAGRRAKVGRTTVRNIKAA